MPVINEKSLCDLLETNHWFRAGTPVQFIKLLEANAQGAELTTLTAIIWACSDRNVSREEIYDKLRKQEQQELDAFVEYLLLSRNGEYVDQDALIEDPCICYSFV